jgi:hypothetical protein
VDSLALKRENLTDIRHPCARLSRFPSVSALLILAGDESNDKAFPVELMSQVKALRDELDSEKLRVVERASLARRFKSEGTGDCFLLSKTVF